MMKGLIKLLDFPPFPKAAIMAEKERLLAVLYSLEAIACKKWLISKLT